MNAQLGGTLKARSRWGAAVAAVALTAISVLPGTPAAASPAVAIITRLAGNANGSSGTPTLGVALNSALNYPYQIDRDSDGNLYFVDWGSRRPLKLSTTGVLSAVAGNGSIGTVVTGGQATS